MYIFTKAAKFILVTGLSLSVSNSIIAQQTDSISQAQTDSVAAISSVSQGPRISVTAVDAATGKYVSGARIVVPGYSASITNDLGVAKISVPNLDAAIIFDAPGYQGKEVFLKGRSSISVNLYEHGFSSPFAVTGASGESSMAKTPFATSTVRTVDPWKASTKETPDTYLQGKLSGVNVVRRSGTPSIGANLFVRGINSFNTTNQPLIVLDGVIYNNDAISSLFSGFSNNVLENVDVKDIEEIRLVKDAGASLYGTKGGNGVLFITTRRPVSEDTKIDFASYAGFNGSVSKSPVMGTETYRSYLASVLQTTGLTDAQIYSLPFLNNTDAGNPDYYKYHNVSTNWQNEVYRNGHNQNYHLNVSGGDNIAKYNLSLGYVNNQGAIRGTDLDRYFTRFNADFNFSKKFTAQTNLSFSSSSHTLANQGQAHKTSLTYLALAKSPFTHPNEVGATGLVSPNYSDSDILGFSNPAVLVNKMDALNTNYRVVAGSLLAYQLNAKFKLQTQFGITYDKVRDRLFIPNTGVVRDTLGTNFANNTIGSNTNRLFAIFNDARLTYNSVFNNVHSLSGMFGVRLKKDKYEDDVAMTYNSSTDDYRSLTSGSSLLRQFGGGLSDMLWLNTYVNLNYRFKNKYIVSLNTAIDGSSRFGKDAPNSLAFNGNKYAVLPSIGAAWLLSSESFLANSKQLDLLKLRLSYGLVGNDDIGDYSAKAYYVPQNLYGLQGYARGNVSNTALKWETIEKLNAGIDVSILGERLNVSLDVYQNNAKDLLMFDPVNPITGFDVAISNSAAIRTNGVDLSLNSRILNSRLKWDMGLTLSRFKSKVTRLISDDMETEYGGATLLTRVGSSPSLFYGHKTNGVYSTTAEAQASNLSNKMPDETIYNLRGGDVRFVNMNTDNIIDQNDRVVIGDPTPDFTGLFGNNFSYRNWTMDAIFTFSYGNDVYNGPRRSLESMSGFANQLESVRNRWVAEGQVTNVPRAAYGDPAVNSRFSDRWIEDGSYLRLRTVSIGYNFKLNSNYFKTLKLYANGNNLVTFTKYLGHDPEFSATRSIFSQGVDIGLEPQFRTVQLGVRVGL